jgi:predicted alpha/beta superfamily hydrolase
MQVTIEQTGWRDYVETRAIEGHSVVGALKVYHDVRSATLGNTRDLFVYLPRSYPTGARRYPVVYMHDGQNLFDHALSYAGEWQVDETMEALSHEGIEAIVVGVPNAGMQRLEEYTPFRDARGTGGQGAKYVDFLANMVKPLIDRDFCTLPDREHTGVLGSSLGGLISMFAFFHRPEVFGFAGVMSPSFWFAQEAIFPYVQRQPFVPGRLYIDAGTAEDMNPRRRLLRRPQVGNCAINVRRMHSLLLEKGYSADDLLVYEEPGGIHHESAWARRLPDALRFLLPKE